MVNVTTSSKILTTCEPPCASLFHIFPVTVTWTAKNVKSGYCPVLLNVIYTIRIKFIDFHRILLTKSVVVFGSYLKSVSCLYLFFQMAARLLDTVTQLEWLQIYNNITYKISLCSYRYQNKVITNSHFLTLRSLF